MRWLLAAVGSMTLLGTGTESLGAQGRLRGGAGAGIAMPSGVLQDQANPGWRALATLDVWLPEMPASLRVDAAYDRFGFKATQEGFAERVTGARAITSASLSVSVGSSDTLSKFAPYALGGVTMNRIGCVGTSAGTYAERLDCAAASQMGWTAGLGTRFIMFGRRGFADARVHCVLRWVKDLCYIPVTVGLLLWSHDVSTDDQTGADR
jgi:hypothetical protein